MHVPVLGWRVYTVCRVVARILIDDAPTQWVIVFPETTLAMHLPYVQNIHEHRDQGQNHEQQKHRRHYESMIHTRNIAQKKTQNMGMPAWDCDSTWHGGNSVSQADLQVDLPVMPPSARTKSSMNSNKEDHPERTGQQLPLLMPLSS